jgi:ATP synthase protein I
VGGEPRRLALIVMPELNDLRKRVEQQAKRMRKAERERPTLISQTIYMGTIGLLIVLPAVGGAYLGNWLDGLASEYSTRWTVSLILVGIFVGALNVFLFIRE